MTSYPYSSSPPPPPPPCSNTTSPILQPPPPPPPPACNHTPPPAHYSPSPPSLSPPPCNCNKPTPTLPPPHLPPPPPPSASLSAPPPPPPSPHRYSPPIHSPPPPKSQPSPVLPPPSPPSYFPPPSPDYSPPLPPTPLLQPPSPSPEPPLCHCVCPSPWPSPPNPYNSIPPNYYAPAPSPLSSGNHQRTVIVTAFVSLGGVFFLSFIVIGLLSVAMKKKIFSKLRPSGGPEADPLSQEERQEPIREFQSIPAGTEPVMQDPKAQEVSAPPDEGVVKQGEGVQRIPSETKKKSVDPNVERDSFGDNQGKVDGKLGEPSGEQSGDKIEGVDEGKSNEGNNKPLDDRTDASPPDEESKSNTIPEESNEGASNESQKKPRVPKFKKVKGGKTGKEKHSGMIPVLNATLALYSDEAEQFQDDENDQEQVSGTEAQDEDEKVKRPNEDEESKSNTIPEESNEGASNKSQKKPRVPKINNAKGKKGKGKHSGRIPVLNAALALYPDEAEQFQDDENDQEQVSGTEAQDEDEKVDRPNEDEESKSNTIPEESNEGASNESQKKPRVPKINNTKGGKKGKGNHSGRIPVLNAALALYPDEAEQFQDDENDQEQVSGTEAQDEDEKVERPNEDEQEAKERDGKSLSDQTEANKTNSAQDVNEESNNSKKKLRLPKEKNLASNSENKRKGKPSSSSGVTKGKEQLFGVSQVPNPANIFDLGGAGNFQDGDNDEEPYRSKVDEETYELEPEDDDKEMIAGGSNRADEIVKHANADEQELNERHGEPLSRHQSERYTRDSAQHVEEESSTLEEKSKDSRKILSLPKKKKPSTSSGFKKGKEESSGICEVPNAGSYFDQDDDAPQDDNNEGGEVTQLESLVEDENLNSGGSNDTSEEVVPPSNADAVVSNECENQSESDNRGATEDAEQESTAIKEESNDCSRKPMQDVENPYVTKEDSIHSKRKQAPKKGRGSSSRSHPQGKIRYSNFDQLLNEVGDVYSEAVQSQEDDNDGLQMEESELQHDDDEDLNSGGNDSSRAISLDDVEGEVSDPFASAQGSKQALNKVVVLAGGDYKDDKAKAHEMKSSSSKKDLQERQHRTQAKKNFNLGKIGTAASLRDQGTAMVSLDDEDDNVQESEPFVSNVDSYFGQLQTSARGIEQSPNFFGNLTTKSDIDQVEELKSLGEGSYKGKKAEVQKLSKDSRRIKGHIKGLGTKIEPPKVSQIVTGRIDDDLGVLGKGLEYLGGNQEGGSDKDGSGKEVTGSGRTSRGPQQIFSLVQSMAATDEGDPNPELEICEDDRELESDLSLQEPSAGEVEPSTDDQSVFATADDDSDVLQFRENEYDEEPAESNKDVLAGKPLPRPRATNLRGKRRA